MCVCVCVSVCASVCEKVSVGVCESVCECVRVSGEDVVVNLYAALTTGLLLPLIPSHPDVCLQIWPVHASRRCRRRQRGAWGTFVASPSATK